jgi:hypothetical protein
LTATIRFEHAFSKFARDAEKDKPAWTVFPIADAASPESSFMRSRLEEVRKVLVLYVDVESGKAASKCDRNAVVGLIRGATDSGLI